MDWSLIMTIANASESQVCFLENSIKHVVADECPIVSKVEIVLPIVQILLILFVSVIYQGSSEMLPIFFATVMSTLILLAVWLLRKSRRKVNFRMKEIDYEVMKKSALTPAYFDVHKQEAFFEPILRTTGQTGVTRTGGKMSPLKLILTRLLQAYVGFCVLGSWLFMTVGRVKLNQHIRSGKSAAKGLAEEWEYEIEQEHDLIIQAKKATYMVLDAVRFSYRYGFVNRAVKAISKRFRLNEERCECGKRQHECSHNDIKQPNLDKKKF